MRASNHQAYEAAVRNYAKRVPAKEHARTYDAGLSLGILVGACQVLGFQHTSEAVQADVEEMRAALYVRNVPSIPGYAPLTERPKDWRGW